MSTRVVAIVQARMASSRLPGKVMMDVEGRTMLARVLERTRLASRVNAVLLATSTEATDDVIEDYCRQHGIEVFRGSHFDVLDRYYKAAGHAGADIVVRITADCPLMDPQLIDMTLGALEADGHRAFDFAATRLPPPWKRTYPIGLDVEACRIESLAEAWREAKMPVEREHVMPYLYRGVRLSDGDRISTGVSETKMRIAILGSGEDLGHLRWTVDTTQDLAFVRAVFAAFPGRVEFGWREVLALVSARPELARINQGVRHKSLGEVDEHAAARGTE